MVKQLFSAFGVFALGVAAHAAVETGALAPDFTLTAHDGSEITLSDHTDGVVVLEWTNFGCPFVRKHYDSGNMQDLQAEAVADGVKWLSIVSSAPSKQGYLEPSAAANAAATEGFAGTALLLDPAGDVGRAYGAQTTPHMYVIAGGNIVYQGAIDSIPSWRQQDIPAADNYVRQALANIAAGEAVATAETDAYGCSVKY